MKTSQQMTNAEVAALLRAVSAAYQVKGEDRFRIRAYDLAADSVEQLTLPLKTLIDQGKLADLPGIGAAITQHLEELFTHGRVRHFNQVMAGLPPAMFALLDVPGIGPKTALTLCQELKLTTTNTARTKLLRAAQAGKIRILPGFGDQSETDIIDALQGVSPRTSRLLLPEAEAIAGEVIDYLRHHPAVRRIEPLGSLRRRAPTVGDIDIAVATLDSPAVINHFVKYPHTREVLVQGDNTARLVDYNNRQIDIKTVPPNQFGSLLQHFTGSKPHNIRLRELALQKHLSLSEHGIKKGSKLLTFTSEAQFYQALGLPLIPPELREDSGEIEAALRQAQGKPSGLPDLVELNDIKGDLHTHTNFNWHPSHDAGVNSPEELIAVALKLGYQYLGIGDHHPSSSTYKTPELIIKEMSRRTKLIDHLKSTYEKGVKGRTIKVLNSLEVDIKVNGDLALPLPALEQLDFIVVSVHANFHLNKTAMTQRIITGLAHPQAKILGHPTGRLLNRRNAYDLDWDKIFAFCREHRKALEINAHPARSDLPDNLIRAAVNKGVKLVINTDAHAAAHLQFMNYGVSQARRGWATKNDIINTWNWEKFREFMLES